MYIYTHTCIAAYIHTHAYASLSAHPSLSPVLAGPRVCQFDHLWSENTSLAGADAQQHNTRDRELSNAGFLGLSLSPSLSLFFALPLVLHTYIYTYRGQTEARLCCCVAAAQRNSDSIRHFYVDTFNSVETHGARTVAAASLPSLIYRRYGEGTRRRREERAARALRARRRVNNCFRIFPFNLGRR